MNASRRPSDVVIWRKDDTRELWVWRAQRLAAALLRAVNDRHALIDGNKRASMRLTDEFLGLNGYHLEGSSELLVEIGWTAGRHGYPSDAALAEVLHPLVVSGAPEAPFDERYPQVIADLAR